MCQFHGCGTETEPSGFCIVCGKKVCSDCADKKNPKMHATCNFCNWINWTVPPEGSIDTDAPFPC
ncbi:MAG: hypothetical protein AYK18_01610 [Theionarchaea archaeon DG-70]|nr:MAG: hypothetical protein AYK18_01610 [Theionarchaea archaeon DG-70]